MGVAQVSRARETRERKKGDEERVRITVHEVGGLKRSLRLPGHLATTKK